ncbi:MAG: hypothetical protein EA001_02090 [Oscillatoriales cyanobacterium]|nr:MAG: hypothetical protein EA001_02090 [Oscillatoriales cyanobacterium]
MLNVRWSLGGWGAIATAAVTLMGTAISTVQPVQAIVPAPLAQSTLTIPNGTTPIALTLQELDDQWRVFTVTGQIETSNMLSMTAAVFGASPTDYYTKGETTQIGSDLFLIAYRIPPGRLAQAEDVVGSVPVQLSLVNLRLAASLNDFRPFNLATEMERMKAAIQTRAASPFNMFGSPPRPMQPLPRPRP